MFKDKKVIVVMPAYNAAKTLCKTYEEVMAQQIVDLVILVLMQAMMKLLLYETCAGRTLVYKLTW